MIGKEHRAHDASQSKVTFKEVDKVAKYFEATTHKNQFMKNTRDSQGQVNFTGKFKTGNEATQCPSTPLLVQWLSPGTASNIEMNEGIAQASNQNQTFFLFFFLRGQVLHTHAVVTMHLKVP